MSLRQMLLKRWLTTETTNTKGQEISEAIILELIFQNFPLFQVAYSLLVVFEITQSSHNCWIQLRDPKNDFIFNFNFHDRMKNLWTVWISHKINQHYSTPEKMSLANVHLTLCKLLETELRLAQRLAQML